jgi:hypothetical protein
MEEQEDSLLTVLEKNGLGPAAAILVAPAIDYWKQTIKPGDHLERMKAVRIFNPLHVLGIFFFIFSPNFFLTPNFF